MENTAGAGWMSKDGDDKAPWLRTKDGHEQLITSSMIITSSMSIPVQNLRVLLPLPMPSMVCRPANFGHQR
jgi:hypothetical protein